MQINEQFILELQHESSMTRKMLERVPMEKADWKPHEKSMTLGRLATHVAEIPHWISDVIHFDDFDFANPQHYSKLVNATSHENLMERFQLKLDKAIVDLKAMKEEEFKKIWTVRAGEKVMVTLPKIAAIRSWGFSHFIHHRGQLSVYLRLLNILVPGMYGPSADES